MNSAFAIILHRTLLLAVVMLGAVCGDSLAQVTANPEMAELKINLLASANRVRELESRLVVAERLAKSSAEALATANARSAEATQRYESIRGALSGLGAMAVLEQSGDSVQQRLLSALAELKVTKERLSKIEVAAQTAIEQLASPSIDGSVVSKALGDAVSQTSISASAGAVVLATKPEAGLAIINVTPNSAIRAGARVEIQNQGSESVKGSVVEVREHTACVCYESGLSLTSSVQVGAPVILTLSQSF
jgi:hypothetical protein